jgi:hypothetical protein
MKHLLFFLPVLFTGYAFQKHSGILTLSEAMDKGIIKVKVTGAGGYSGKCLEAEIKNIGSKKTEIIIEPGMIFKPEDPDMQNILVVKEVKIPLEKNAIKKVKLTGFCCEASDRSPAGGTMFKPCTNKNNKLSELARFLDKHTYPDDMMQYAVWSVSDNKSVSHIYNENSTTVKDLREEVCRLTGQKNEWFNTNVTTYTNDEGYIETQPVRITGEIKVRIEKPTVLFQGVYKENGEIAWEPHKVADIGSTGTMTYQFKLKVKGWDKGKYYVKVTSEGNQLLKQEFEI